MRISRGPHLFGYETKCGSRPNYLRIDVLPTILKEGWIFHLPPTFSSSFSADMYWELSSPIGWTREVERSDPSRFLLSFPFALRFRSAFSILPASFVWGRLFFMGGSEIYKLNCFGSVKSFWTISALRIGHAHRSKTRLATYYCNNSGKLVAFGHSEAKFEHLAPILCHYLISFPS